MAAVVLALIMTAASTLLAWRDSHRQATSLSPGEIELRKRRFAAAILLGGASVGVACLLAFDPGSAALGWLLGAAGGALFAAVVLTVLVAVERRRFYDRVAGGLRELDEAGRKGK